MPKQKITKKLYGGKIEIDFFHDPENQKTHYYKLGKKRLIGVTTPLGIIDKPALIPWAANQACDYIKACLDSGIDISYEVINEARSEWKVARDKAANKGTEVHKWAEQYINDEDPELPDDQEVLNGVTAFLEWVNEHGVEFISSERIVYSIKHNYVGTMDAEAIIDDKLSVIDFKTSSGVYNEMRYQVAAYQKAAEEEGSKYTGNRIIVRFDKQTGGFEVHELEDGLEEDFNSFLAAKTLYERNKQLEKQKRAAKKSAK